MGSESNRYRKKLTVTIDPDTYNVINSIAHNRGMFVDECVRAYITGQHFFWVTVKFGMVHIFDGDDGGYCIKKFDDDIVSPEFGSMQECLDWLKNECPELRIQVD